MADTIDKEDISRPTSDTSVDYVRAVDLEERLSKIILQLEAQNKAWEKCLTLLTEMNATLSWLFEKYKSADLLLEEHPPIKGPRPVTVEKPAQPQPQPFNNYTELVPYGTELEEEREASSQSLPSTQTDIPESTSEYAQSDMGPEYTQGKSPPGYGDEPESSPESAAPNSADSATQEPQMRISPGPPVSSKAELLERVEKVP